MCGSTSLLFVEAGQDCHGRKRQLGMCLRSVGSGLARFHIHRWPKSLSLFFLWLSCSAHSQAPSLSSPLPPPLPSQMKTFPLVNTGQKSWVEDTTQSQKDISLSGCGMLMIWSKGGKPGPMNGFVFLFCLCMHVSQVCFLGC